MLAQNLEFAAGLAITLAALTDIFLTLLAPGASNRFSVVLRWRWASLPIWRRLAPRRRRGDARPSNLYAPVTFLLAFMTWALLMLLGYGMMIHALGGLFEPEVTLFSDGLWIAGSSLVTLGVSEFDASGISRWVILAAGLSGFAALTTAVTFIFEVQSGLHDREPQVLALATLVETPPSGIRILEIHAELGATDDLPDFMTEWRDWSAATLHSHLAYPVLNYFRSMDAEGDWLAALEAVLDASALLVGCAADQQARGPATLLHRTGSRTAERLCSELGLQPEACRVANAELDELIERLRGAGYGVREDGARERFVTLRDAYAPHIKALAKHLGGNRAPILPEEPANSD